MVTVASNAVLDPTSSLTVEGWVVQSATSGSSGHFIWVIGGGDPFGASGGGYALGYLWNGTTPQPSFYVVEQASGAGPQSVGCRGGTTSPGVHHLAGTYSGSSGVLAVWVDGVQACTSTAPPTVPAPYPLAYGGGGGVTFGNVSVADGTAEPFQGTLDDVRISNAVLYTAPFTPVRHPTATSSTVGLWSTIEGSGTTTTPGRCPPPA
jgi:hypothetical protein